MFPRALIALCLTAALLNAQTPESRLEAAVHAEVVDGDVKSALDQYQKLLASARPVAARALLGVADCQQKLGHSSEAQTAYNQLIAQYADQPSLVSEAKTKLAALAAQPAGPVNLNFEAGIGQPNSGWIYAKSWQPDGYTAEVRHTGCRQGPACAVVVAPNPPMPNRFGNLTQGFDATPYRGKTIRLRSYLKMESSNPGDGAQMWMRVDRGGNHTVAAFDNMNNRPVTTPNWTPAEIVEKVADDADHIFLGVMAINSGRAWVDGITFEVLPNDAAPTSYYSAAPLNLDFRKGAEGSLPPQWGAVRVEGFSAEIRQRGCRTANPCAVVIGSATPKQYTFGNLFQTFKAENYRGKTVRVHAWLKLDQVDPTDSAQMWLRVDPKDPRPAFFDNMDDRPVRTAEWREAEIVGKVSADAENLSFGLMSVGKGIAWLDSVSFEVVPDGTPLTGTQANPPLEPRNLNFSDGFLGGVPTAWWSPNIKGYTAEIRQSGCLVGPSCVVVIASPTPQPNMIGHFTQSFGAAHYRGKTIRIRAKLKLDSADSNDKAQMWLRVDRPEKQIGFFDNMDNRPVQTASWTDAEIVAKIDPDADLINFGVMSIGKGQAWVDALSFEIVPDGTPQTGTRTR